jgi:hypothetical protein
MRATTITAIIIAAAIPAAAQTGSAQFTKDVKQSVMIGEKTRTIDAELAFSDEALTVTRKTDDATVIPFSAITGATYDRRARQRKMLGLPMTGQGMAGAAQKVQHFLTVRYKTEQAAGFVELELGKDIANRVVATLETKSGKPVEKIGS